MCSAKTTNLVLFMSSLANPGPLRLGIKLKFCLISALTGISSLHRVQAFQPISTPSRSFRDIRLHVSELDKLEAPEPLKNKAPPVKIEKPVRSSRFAQNIEKDVEILDPSTYESMLLESWDVDPSKQKGFDWEIEKLRRNFAGLRQMEDGTWVRRQSIFDFLVNKAEFSTATVRKLNEPPKPVNLVDVWLLFATNLLSNVGFGDALGMAKVPNAVIQKYEGSFFSFIKGALGGDLQTLAGGPLFLLLAKYYQDYGPIFNLSFGPKSFLVVSDPVMARHILKASPEAYCKGMLAEILEPIMGKGLIPADPATWKVCFQSLIFFILFRMKIQEKVILTD